MAHPINATTLDALDAFPRLLEAHYSLVPIDRKHWAPTSWTGVPSEAFTAIEQVCHVRDIEIEGYQVRLQRVIAESNPFLPSIDSESVAKEGLYHTANVTEVLASFRQARVKTIALIKSASPDQLARTALFEGYGPVTFKGLVHFLCSHDQQHLAGLQWLLGKMDGEARDIL